MDQIEEIQLCEVANDVEAAMVVNLLREDGIPARSDSNAAMNVFGGLPFEPGHKVFVPASMAHKVCAILSNYPHFHDLRNSHEPGH